MLSTKLKNIIVDKLYNELSNLTFILFEDSIWLINTEKKLWLIEYRPDGLLIYRYDFFNEFFIWYSLDRTESESIIVEVLQKLPTFKKIKGFEPITETMVGIHTWNGLINNMLSDGVVKT